MEHLTKQQIILLALFVSFFSSIASGIVVVSLMEQAPSNVTQTINRVVERTIERVTPSAATTTKETIIVREDQALVDAIAKASKSLVSITAGSDRFIGRGVIVTASGKVVARAGSAMGQQLYAHLEGGNTVTLSFVSTDISTGLSLYQADQSTDPKNSRAYSAATLANSDGLKLGQSLALISEGETLTVATGIVSSALGITSGFDSGAILVNLLGEVVGMKNAAQDTGSPASFIPSNIIKTYAATGSLHN